MGVNRSGEATSVGRDSGRRALSAASRPRRRSNRPPFPPVRLMALQRWSSCTTPMPMAGQAAEGKLKMHQSRPIHLESQPFRMNQRAAGACHPSGSPWDQEKNAILQPHRRLIGRLSFGPTRHHDLGASDLWDQQLISPFPGCQPASDHVPDLAHGGIASTARQAPHWRSTLAGLPSTSSDYPGLSRHRHTTHSEQLPMLLNGRAARRQSRQSSSRL